MFAIKRKIEDNKEAHHSLAEPAGQKPPTQSRIHYMVENIRDDKQIY